MSDLNQFLKILFPKQGRKFLLSTLVAFNVFIVLFWILFYPTVPDYRIYKHEFTSEQKDKPCNFPRLQPFTEEIAHYVEKPSPLNCAGEANPEVGELAFRVNGSYLIRDFEFGTTCCYRPFFRVSDSEFRLHGNCYEITRDITQIPSEYDYIEVLCIQDGPEYRDAFAMLHKRSKQPGDKQKKATESSTNVIIFGIDSTSHMNFIRTMPKSHEYMIKTLGAVGMHGYFKVGENTLPNVVPLLTGLDLQSFQNLCSVATKDKHNTTSFRLDTCPFIWKEFAQQGGHLTNFAEDDPGIAIFNLNLANAFTQPPTDYYIRPLSQLLENHMSYGDGLCYGPRLPFQVLLDNMLNFVEVSKTSRRPYFHFSWTTKLTHADLNNLNLADLGFLKALQILKSQHHLDNTVMIIMSDHGTRVHNIRNSAQGKIEDRMPLLYWILPQSWDTKFSKAVKNLKLNANRLTTVYDVHETLKDLLNLNRLKMSLSSSPFAHVGSQKPTTGPGLSLFRNEFKEIRTCAEAGVPALWCLCQKKESMSTDNNAVVNDAANFVMASINHLTQFEQKCAKLKVQSVTEALRWENEYDNTKFPFILQIAFIAFPGNGIFEATVAQRSNGQSWILTDQVARINKYEDQSECVSQAFKKYCFCL